MNTARRLESYSNSFAPDIVHAVSAIAEEQHGQSFDTLTEQYGVNRPARRLATEGLRHSVEYLEFTPTEDHDRTHARVLYTPMGIPVNHGTALRAIRLFAADPTERLLVVGSPSLVNITANRVRPFDLKRVYDGDLEPAVRPGLAALIRNKGLHTVDTLGYSYGADAAAQAAATAHTLDSDARRGVWIESAAAKQRTPLQLLQDFKASEKELDRYVEQVDSSVLLEARDRDRADVRYILGMLRASNLAIGACLARGGFSGRVTDALAANPQLHAAIGWGTASELGGTEATRAVYTTARDRFGRDRVSSLDMIDMHHPGGDDIDLHAAMMLQGLRDATPGSTVNK